MSAAAERVVAPPRVRTAAITNLGCKVNQAEMEAAARLLRERGIAVVDGHDRADLVLVNTCTVTSEADAKSRHAVRRARRTSPDAEIVVTGCSVQVGRAAIAAADPAARLIDNRSKDALLAEIAELVGETEPGDAGGLRQLPWALPTLSGVEIEGIADGRAAVERTRAFVKVQDGCSFFCTYCIIPAARGPERSHAPETVLDDVRRALRAGHREIVLTGINIGTYDGGWSERGFRGAHRRSALTLAGLVRRILAETAVERLRVSSIEPQHLDDELLETWSEGAPRTLPHLHLPLQSGDDGVLHRMGRRYDSAGYQAIVGRARSAIAGVAVHADAIVGFPTEDDAAWTRSIAFIRSLELAGVHVFRYSARPGTAAVRMRGQVDEPTKKRRAAELLALAAESRARWAAAHVGAEADVLFESRLDDGRDGRWVGHAADHTLVAATPPDRSPDAAPTGLENQLGRVRVDAVDPMVSDRVVGRILSLSPPAARVADVG
ncbi:MAG TPA: tRNA (N(6)-L-threonylcarbamoyladenosine(37)-C(2))-methylthiotransferase MtaB [Candidatus Limnocylindrales bacterium]|nr:tRNA (N(6)-L-threonylcarbamoyladenosine(37)-C(2))-methylthiotransferase MtaB [Candidatus Limnocylindrales bacterium]